MKRILIVDIDDTLFDWTSMWFASFSYALKEIEAVSQYSRAELIGIFKSLHQTAGTSERGIEVFAHTDTRIKPNEP